MRFNPVFDFLNGDTGAYAPLGPVWLNQLLGYLDCIWFGALLGWVLVLFLWWGHTRHHAPPEWRWLPWTAGTGLLSAGIMFLDLASARLGSSIREAYIYGDYALTALAALACAGWWWELGRQVGGRLRWGTWVLAAATPAIVPWMMSHPHNWGRSVSITASNYLAVAGLLAAVPWWFRPQARRWPRLTLTLAALVPIFSTVGPWGSYVFFMRHKYTPVTLLCLLWGAFAAAVAWLALLGLLRMERRRLGPDKWRELWTDARPFVMGAAAWLVLGGIAAWLFGQRQRTSAEDRALDQARLAAGLLDPAIFARMTGPAFRLDLIQPGARPYFPPTRIAHSRFLANGGEADAKRTLRRIALANRTMIHVRFLTQRDGWLVGAAGYSSVMANTLADAFAGTAIDGKTPLRRWSFGFVLLARRPTATDLSRWNDRAEWLEGPLTTASFTNPVIFARAPLVADDGRMLGWLEFTYMADAFLAETFQARIAPFVGTTLGIAMIGLLFIRRRAARAQEAAQQAAAVAAASARVKTEFLAKVSHELRTPLQSVLGYGELLGTHVTGAAGRAHLAAQRQHADLMLRLVNDLLDLSAMETGAFRLVAHPTPLAEAVQQAAESLRPRAEAKSLALACTAEAAVPAWALADSVRLRQIVLNLVGNAVKFTAAGRIDVALTATAEETGSVMLALTVRDTGPGIAPAEQLKLFQPFSRLDLTARHEGSGLGLALTAALCRSAGGDLTVESDGRSGSTFRARLRVQPCPPPTAAPSAALPSLAGRRILVVDDNALVRELFATHLSSLGVVCETAADGAEALTRALATSYDALVVDFAMPRLDGLALTRRLRAAGSTARIVGVSAHSSAADSAEARAAGMDAFLSKPVELGALNAALTSLVPPPPSESKHALLRTHLATLFRADVPAQCDAIATAIAAQDWTALHASAHYLKNSAGVVGDETLYDACGVLEDAATARDPHAAEAAWATCRTALAPWLSPPGATP